MKALAVVLSLASATSVFGQGVYRGFGSVVFPGGSSATSQGVTRNFGGAVFPGGMQKQPVYGGASVIGVFPGVGATPTPAGSGRNSNFRRTPPTYGRRTRSTPSFVYAFPVFIGGSYAPQELAPQQEPPPQEQAVPVMIQVGPDGRYTTTERHQTSTVYQPEPETVESPDKAADSPHYLLAFKDHSIYSAVAYWADGDTLHYFTAGNIHNQASMALIDRELTERLNRELGIEFTLPAAK